MKIASLAAAILLAATPSLSAQIPNWMPRADDPEEAPAPNPSKKVKHEVLPSDMLMAQMLLTAPVNTPETRPPEDRYAAVREAINITAVRWQIMDERETRYFITENGDQDQFQRDLDCLRTRYQELKDAPKIEELGWLPPKDVSEKLIQFNRAFKNHLETRLIWENDRADIIRVVIDETEQCYRAWDAIRDIKCDYQYVTYRRLAGVRLKKMMGEEAYNRFELPEYVPSWRFRPLN